MHPFLAEISTTGVSLLVRRAAELVRGQHAELVGVIRAATEEAAAAACIGTGADPAFVAAALLEQLTDDDVAVLIAVAWLGDNGQTPSDLDQGFYHQLGQQLLEDLSEHQGLDPVVLLTELARRTVQHIKIEATAVNSRLAALADRYEHAESSGLQARSTERLGIVVGSVSDRLEQLRGECENRLRRRLEALALDDTAVEQLVGELLVPRPQPAGPLTVLEGDVGGGKTTTAVQQHLNAIELAREPGSTSPLPVYVEAHQVNSTLDAEVARWWTLAEVDDRGVALVVDELDRISTGDAQQLISDVRRLLRRNAKSQAIIASRPTGVAEIRGADRQPVRHLTDEEAEKLIQDLTGRRVQLWSRRAELRSAVRRPLFAIAYAVAIGEGDTSNPMSQLTLALAQRAVDAADIEGAERLLGRAAAAAIDAAYHPVPISEVTTSISQREALRRTRVVQIDGELLRWPVALLAEWFAAEHLMADPVRLDRILGDPELADRWRYAIATTLETAPTATVDQAAEALFARQPALAGWVLEHLPEDRPVAADDNGRPPVTWGVLGSRLHVAASAIARGLGPLATVLPPFGHGEHVTLRGALRDDGWVTYGWHATPPDHDDVGPLTEHRQLQGMIRGTRVSTSPVWPWRCMFSDLRDGLARALKEFALLEGPEGLHQERDYSIAHDVLRLGSLKTDPIPVERLQQLLERLPTDEDTTVLIQGRRKAIALEEIRRIINHHQSDGRDTVDFPWPAPDQFGERTGLVPFLWSTGQLRRRVDEVVETAVATSEATIERWFPHLEHRLGHPRHTYTVWIFPGDPEKGWSGMPSFVRAWMPFNGARHQVVIVDREDVNRIIGEAERAADMVSWGELPGIYSPIPVQALATDMLWTGVSRWGWVTGSPPHIF